MTARRWAIVIAIFAVIALAAAAVRRNVPDEPSTPQDSSTSPAASGSPATRGLTPGPSDGAIVVDGRDRTYRLYVPASLPDGPVPLVVGLHGGLGSGEQFARDSAFDAQADAGEFIAVYPDGITARILEARTWNAGQCCGRAVDEGVDDVAFIEALLDMLEATLPVDTTRVFVVGHSNGAMMAYRLACELPDRIVAIASVAGSLETPCDPARPVSILSIHGDADESHPVGGGSGSRSLTDVEYTSVAASIERWRLINGCGGDGEVTQDGPIATHAWRECADRTEVISIIVGGGSHAWPGGRPTGAFRAEPSDDLDATAVIWEFFESQSHQD